MTTPFKFNSFTIFEAVYHQRHDFLDAVLTAENINLFFCEEDEGKTLLMASVEMADPYLFHFLLLRGANFYQTTTLRGDNVFLWCCKYGTRATLKAVIQHLIHDGRMDINVTNQEGNTGLMLACSYDRVDLVLDILPLHPDLECRNRWNKNVFQLMMQSNSHSNREPGALHLLLADYTTERLFERVKTPFALDWIFYSSRDQ